MKRALIITAAALALCLTACKKPAEPVETPETPGSATLTAKIIEVADGSLLAAEPDGGLYFADAVGAQIIGDKPLSPGMTVEIAFGGDIMESFPAQIAGVSSIKIISDEADLVGLYLKITDDLWNDGGTLKEDIDVIAFDLSEAENLSRGEKQALTYLASGKYGYETVEGTFEELREQGYIEKDELWFPCGVLIRFRNMEFKSGSFTFAADIWRSGTGAIIYGDCSAKLSDGEWSYTPGGWAIS